MDKEPTRKFYAEQVKTEDVASVAAQMGHDSPQLQKDWQQRAVEDGLAMFVVRDGDTVIASVNLLTTGPEEPAVRSEIGPVPTIIALDVNADYRRLGIGSKVMDACEDYIQTHPNLPQKIALGVVEPNVPAREMYEKRSYYYHKVKGENYSFETSWPEVGVDGNEYIRTARCLLMIKDLL